MPNGYFITGTDTGVGKTVASGALIRGLISRGRKVCAMKPVETGCGKQGGVLMPFDGMFLRQIAQMEESHALITPCCFETPLAPLAASEREDREVNVGQIMKNFYGLLKKYDTAVVEGIGGLMVPLMKDYYVADLAKELGLPLIVVARPGMGTLNHTLLTVHYAIKIGLTVAGVILNYSMPAENSMAEKTNPTVLENICPVPLLGILPHLKSMDEATLEKAAVQNLNMDLIASLS